MPSDLTNKQLQAETAALAKQAARDSDEISKIAAYFTEEAQDTRRVADMIGAKQVDPDTVAETSELGKIIDGLSEAALTYANITSDTSRIADQAAQTTRTTHDGIGEQVNRSPVRNIHDVHRDWLTQE
jgi:hypothetical protein